MTMVTASELDRRLRAVELVAADRPGLLSKVGQTFIAQGVDIQTAKIMTIGERAEDVFYISDELGRPLGDDAKEQLREALIRAIDENTAAARED